MPNITPEQYEKYINALNYDSCEMDIRYLIFKYKVALTDYCFDENNDIDDLELIVDAFLYFSQFEPATDLDEYTEILLELLDTKKYRIITILKNLRFIST